MNARARVGIPMLIAAAAVAAPARIPSQSQEPISTTIGRLSGETVVHADGGARIGRLEASVEFSASTRMGTVQLQFAPSSAATSLRATAQVSADTPQEGFGAVSALVAMIAGRPTSSFSSLRLSRLRVEGDVAAVRTRVDRITAWWDAQGEMSVDGYESPVLTIGNTARLQINAWGSDIHGLGLTSDMRGYAILVFDPSDPTHIISGRIRREEHTAFVDLPLPSPTHATLTPITDTTPPNDFLLCIGVEPQDAECSNQFTQTLRAELAIDVLDDGTIDVRGIATRWVGAGFFTVEGTGNARFDPPR